jgi:hypothetical protein
VYKVWAIYVLKMVIVVRLFEVREHLPYIRCSILTPVEHRAGWADTAEVEVEAVTLDVATKDAETTKTDYTGVESSESGRQWLWMR